MTLTKAEIADSLATKLGYNKNVAKQMVELLFEEIKAALTKGDAVKLSGFGNFAVRSKNSRPGRNPRTGQEIIVTARRVVTFHPGQKLKLSVESYSNNL